MNNDDCRCFVSICRTREEIKSKSDKFLAYLKRNNYQGLLRTKYLPDDFRVQLDCDFEVHFVHISHYGRWCVGRIYKFLETDDFEKLFQSGHEVDKEDD